MAEHASHYTRGEMEVQEHEATFAGFVKLTKWGSLYIATALVFLVLWFCTAAGFLGGLVTAVVVLVVGTLVLSERSNAAHH